MMVFLRIYALVGILLCPIAVLAAEERAVDTAECKEITARVIEAIDAKFDHFSPGGTGVFLKASGINELVLSCTSRQTTGISVVWDQSGFPPNAWFKKASRAAKAVTVVELGRLEEAIRRCHHAALKHKSELSDMEIPNAKIDCQAFTRNGGGVNVGIYKSDR